MNQTWTIAKRELTSLFYSPIGYVAIGVFALVSTLMFFTTFAAGMPATLRSELSFLVWLMVFVVPAISMRLISEETSRGTIELLMTAPVSDTHVILGKWFGALLFYIALLLPIVAHVILLEVYGDPDYGPIFTGLLGVVLVGALYLAIGIFVSAVSSNQIVAFMVTVLITGLLSIGMYMIFHNATWLPDKLRTAVAFINVDQRFSDFGKGLFDLTSFIYFVSGTALFLFVAVKIQESKRWR